MMGANEMARARNIKPAFFTSDQLAECEPLARLLFAGLWTVADRDGRLEDRPKRIKIEVLPYDDCDCENLLQQLAGQGLIVRYTAEGQEVIEIPGFLRHQNPHHKEVSRKLPAPPEEALDKSGASPGHNSDKSQSSRADSLLPISSSLNPDSLSLDSPILIPSKEISVEQKGSTALSADDVGGVVKHYQDYHPKSKPGKKEKGKIRARLQESYSVDDLKAAIDGCHRSPFHCGENDGGKKYQSLELIVRDASHVAQFLEIPLNGEEPVLSERTRRTIRAVAAFADQEESKNEQG
jgi:hypothetical protein